MIQRFRLDFHGFGLSKKREREEAEADYFACNLLVPKDRLHEVCALLRMEGILPRLHLDYLARYFGVSEVVIAHQLRAIGEGW